MEYLIYKQTFFRKTSANHVSRQVKYCFYPERDSDDIKEHLKIAEQTDDNFLRLSQQISIKYKEGDVVKTLERSTISSNLDEKVVTITEPLSSDEMSFLATELSEKVGERNR